MKMYLLSDNVDTLSGMRLAGVDGVVAHTADEVLSAMKDVLEDAGIGILLVTKKLYLEFSEKLLEILAERETPLIVQIPDRHGAEGSANAIAAYIKEATGIQI